jgi:hypothetical protein
MSDFLTRYRRLLKGPASRYAQLISGQTPRQESGGLTESQQEFAPYIAETAAQEAKKNRRIQPLKWIFDLLQRGQYMGVNLLSEVTESIQNREPVGQAAQEALVGLWQGLTGKRKGDFEEFLREVLPPETVEKMERPILGEKQRGKFILGAAPIDIAGLAGNIALDPLTYFDPLKLVRVGGLASKAGRAAAREAATDTTLVALKKMASFKNFDDLAKGFDIQKFTRLWDTAPKEATEYMVRNQPEMARVANEVYKKAYKKALVTPAETLRGGLAKEIDDILAKAQPDYSKALQEATAAGGQEAVERTKEVWEKAFMGPLREIRDKAMGVPEVPSRIIPGGATVTPGGAGVSPKIDVAPAALAPGSQAIPAAYEGAGTRAWNLLGKEIPLPDAQGLNVVQRSIERFSDMVKATPAGKTIGDAWWSWNSQGVLGEIRRAVGIRNPYEKMLRFRELESRQLEANVAIMAKNAFLAVDEFDDETLQQVFKALDTAEIMKGGDPAFDLIKALDDPDFLAKADITGDPAELKRAWEQIHALQESYIGLMDEAVALGIADNHGYIENYLPTQYKQPRGGKRQARIVRQGKTKGSASGFMKKRKQPHVLTVEQEKSQIKALFPRIGDDVAEKLIRQQNVGSFQANLRDLLVYRAVAQAKLQGHVNIVKAFKEFGVPTDLAQGYLRGQVRKSGGGLPAAGLQQIEGKPFKGLLFDSATADILNRAVKSTSDYLKPVKRLLGGFTAWWKGVVTMTTGFHMRNHISNNITGFLKFGPRWFQMRQYQAPAMAGALYALHKADVRGVLKEVGMSEGMFMSLLNRRIGNKTVKELADNAFQRGVITHHTKAFDPSFTAEQFGQGFLRRGSFNPMSQENLGFRGSRKIGDVVENHPRFQSFLMDIDDVAKRTGGDVADSALDFASMEAKKWFIDYQDLSDFEKNVLRGFIPFYTWLRKNIANQMSGVLLYPELYSILPKLEDAVKVEDPSYDETMIPDYMKQFGFFPVMGEDGKFTMFNPNIPIQDLNRIPIVFGDRAPIPSLNELKDDLFASAHPIVKTIVQMLPKKGYDMFYKRDLDYDADAPAALRFFVKTPRMLQWLDGFAKDILNIDEGLGIHLSKDKKVKMNAKIVKVLNDNLPLIRVIDRTLLAANQIIPGFEEAATEAVGFYDTYDMSPPDKMERFFQLLSYYGGIKFKVTDIEENRARWKTDVINKAKEERFRERKREQTGESRELGYLKKRGELLETYDFIF